jgi:hypothetical protein
MAAIAASVGARDHSQVCQEVLPRDMCLTSMQSLASGPCRFQVSMLGAYSCYIEEQNQEEPLHVVTTICGCSTSFCSPRRLMFGKAAVS